MRQFHGENFQIIGRLLALNHLWKRNTKVAVHPCPEHLCVQDATRGEGALRATRGHQEVQAEPDVVRCGGAMDVHEPRRRGWGLCTPLLVLPPCRGETASPNAHPMPCQAAPPRAYRAIA